MAEPAGSGHPIPKFYTTDANGSTVQLEAIRSRRYPERFWIMFHTAPLTVAQLDRVPPNHRTLFAVLTLMDPIQFRRIAARELAQTAKIAQISAERALAMPEADQLIVTNGMGEAAGAKARRLITMTTAEKTPACPRTRKSWMAEPTGADNRAGWAFARRSYRMGSRPLSYTVPSPHGLPTGDCCRVFSSRSTRPGRWRKP